jgi:hypothetical protein
VQHPQWQQKAASGHFDQTFLSTVLCCFALLMARVYSKNRTLEQIDVFRPAGLFVVCVANAVLNYDLLDLFFWLPMFPSLTVALVFAEKYLRQEQGPG